MYVQEKITVCVPSHNRANTISNAIESILKQTYKNIEILIIDNASTDNTEEIVKSFNDPRIRYIFFPNLLEVNYNFMRAISCANTEIICLFHSDDYYFPDIIEKQMKYLKDSTVGAVFSKMIPRRVDKSGKINISNYNYNRSDDKNSIVRYNYKYFLEKSLESGIPVCCPTFMTKKTVMLEVGLLKRNKGLISDISLWLPIVRKYDIIDIKKPMMFYGTSKDQLSYKIHNKRMDQSPQFRVLDNELTKYSNSVSRNTINKYRYRKMMDYIYISKNSFINKKIVRGTKYLLNAFGLYIKTSFL